MAEIKSNLTVVEHVYHQDREDGRDPTEYTSRYSKELDSKEQVYQRHMRVDENRQPIDCGWIDKARLLLIRNDEGKFHVNPTKDELEEVRAKVIEVGFVGVPIARFEISYGESMRAQPCKVKDVWLRCRTGTAKCTITIIPA